MNFARSLLIVVSMVVPSQSSGQSNQSVTASNLIGCWDRQPTEAKILQDQNDGFADTFEVCFDATGTVEAFNLGGSTEYGIEGYGDLFTYTLAERLTFFSEGKEDSSCLVRMPAADVLELHECRGSYFSDNIFDKVIPQDAISKLFVF